MGGDGMSGYSSYAGEETIGLRGYENGSIAYNGYAYDRFTLELRYPFLLGNTTIYGLTFLEGGNAWSKIRQFNPFDMKRSAGGASTCLWWDSWVSTGATASTRTT